MIDKLKNLFFILFFFSFMFLIIYHYTSEKNIKYINISRSSFSGGDYTNLPLLENDTNNIIVYKNDLEEFKLKRKKRFWEKLISPDND